MPVLIGLPSVEAGWRKLSSQRLTSKRFHHPDVGDLTLRIQVFDVRSSPGQELVV